MISYQADCPMIRESKSDVFAEANDAFGAILVRAEGHPIAAVQLPLNATSPSQTFDFPRPRPTTSFQANWLPAISFGLSVLGLFCLVFFLAIGSLKLALQTQISGALFSITFLTVAFLFVARMLSGLFGNSETFQLKLLKMLDVRLSDPECSTKSKSDEARLRASRPE